MCDRILWNQNRWREKAQPLTAVWLNGGFSAKINGSSSIELLCKTEHLCFDFRHFAKLQTVSSKQSATPNNDKMNIKYSFDKRPTADQIIELYDNAGLPRPTNDKERIQKMFDNSNLIVTAWCNDLLVGVSRSITDWVWACYLINRAEWKWRQWKFSTNSLANIWKRLMLVFRRPVAYQPLEQMVSQMQDSFH